MKYVKHQTIFMFVVLACLLSVGCSETTDTKPAANDRTEFNEHTEPRVLLEDGVYPVVLTDEALPKGDPEIKVFELVNVPVEGRGEFAPDKIRVIARPLLRFRNVSRFDFTFEKNECTEVGFQNTVELKAYTRDHVGSRLAVVIDNKVITHHKIRGAIETDQVQITCCTVGGGDHLHKHLKTLKLASSANRQSKVED